MAKEDFLYPDADKHCQPELKAAIARFRMLPLSERADLPLIWWLLSDSTQAFKPTKEDAQYVSRAEGGSQRCENCDFSYFNLRHQVYICSQIRGEIKPEGWCPYWERGKDNPYKK